MFSFNNADLFPMLTICSVLYFRSIVSNIEMFFKPLHRRNVLPQHNQHQCAKVCISLLPSILVLECKCEELIFLLLQSHIYYIAVYINVRN